MSFVNKAEAALLLLASLAHFTAASAIPQIKRQADPATQGAWSDLIELPVIPVAAYVVPAFPESSKVLFFSSWGNNTFGGGTQENYGGGKTQFASLDYLTKSVTHREVAETKHDMFCPGISTLEDGRVLISGGSDANKTTFYDPAADTFTAGPELTTARGYQSSTTMSDGRVFTIGGAFSGPREAKGGEVYDPVADTWTNLPAAVVAPMLTVDKKGVYREDNHAWLVGWKEGSVFQAGPSRNQNWYGADVATGGGQAAAGVRDDDDAMCGIFVMYEPGKIFSAGGAPDYEDSDGTVRAHITTIDKPWENATVERVADMANPRAFANAVVLPDGKVVVTGGQRRAIVFTDTDSVLEAEIFDPATGQWATMAAEELGRNYHSVSILLPDGTVFSGGGGMCYIKSGVGTPRPEKCDQTTADHPNGQIFSPPYLFNKDGTAATRPVVAELEETAVKVGSTIKVTVDTADASLVLVRIGTATHSVNTDQRRIPLTTTVDGDVYTATLEADSGVLLPGHYYLFAVAGGVPSVAKTIQITL